jgi:hypothetical protein
MRDDVPTSCSDVSYYQTLYSYIPNPAGIVMLRKAGPWDCPVRAAHGT